MPFAEVALPLTAWLRAAKPPLPDEQAQDMVDETATDADQAGQSAKRADVFVGTGCVGRRNGAAIRHAGGRGQVGMIDHAGYPGMIRRAGRRG